MDPFFKIVFAKLSRINPGLLCLEVVGRRIFLSINQSRDKGQS